jgi:hypothetical protein
MHDVVALAMAQMILMPVAGLDDEDLARLDGELGSVERAAVGPAFYKDELMVRVLVPGIFIFPPHPKEVEILEDRPQARSALRLVGPPETLLS